MSRYSVYGRTEVLVGRHERGIRCLEWLASRGLVATLSWDSTLRAWDPRIRQAC